MGTLIMSIIVSLAAFLVCNACLAGPELKLGIGYVTTVEVSDTTGGSPLLVEEGIFYDEFSPELSLLWDFGTVSLGPRIAYIRSQDIFGENQPTLLSAWLFGGEFIYNYEMIETGEWLFPMVLSGGYERVALSYRPATGSCDIAGDGWMMEFLLGVERVRSDKISLGFVFGRRFGRANLDDDFLEISPEIDSEGWRFEFFSRYTVTGNGN